MKMKKQFLSILLGLMMVLGLLPGMSLMALAETPAGFVALNENFDAGLGNWNTQWLSF